MPIVFRCRKCGFKLLELEERIPMIKPPIQVIFERYGDRCPRCLARLLRDGTVNVEITPLRRRGRVMRGDEEEGVALGDAGEAAAQGAGEEGEGQA
ncbi:MAG: hypothetical protein DRJ67_05945 [Thermoprotei archaeon]|nr:MAG: hypothetical protein DRJ67_05945 [Thermoprotei archaeon]